MAYSAAVKEAKRMQAIAEVAQQKDSARQAYETFANVSGVFAGMPAKYADVFDPQDADDAAIIDDFRAAKQKIDSALSELQNLGIDALGTDTEV